jgi:hypothetical protein
MGVFIGFNIEFSLLFLRSCGFEQMFLKKKEYAGALLQKREHAEWMDIKRAIMC